MKTTRIYGKRTNRALTLWVKLARAFTVFAHQSHENIKSFGLTPTQFSVLECLGHLGPMWIGDLCRKMLVSGGNMTVVVDNMEEEGLVERIRSQKDRRAIQIRLTREGKRLFDKVFVEHAEFITQTASVLTEKEQENLSRLLKKLGLGIQISKNI